MRRILVTVTVAAAFALPAAPASAAYCGRLLDDACRLVCEVLPGDRCFF